jgi:hypothetical protein
LNETSIQVFKKLVVNILARRRSNAIYNTIPKSQEWLIINCVVHATSWFLFGILQIYKDEILKDDYSKFCKPSTCMVMLKKAWMTSFLFKELLFFFKRFVPNEVFLTN